MASFHTRDGQAKMAWFGGVVSLSWTLFLLAEGRWLRAAQLPLDDRERSPRPARLIGVASGEASLEGAGGRLCLARFQSVESSSAESILSGHVDDRCASRASVPFSLQLPGGGAPVIVKEAHLFPLVSQWRGGQLHPATPSTPIRCPGLGLGDSVERCVLPGDTVEVSGLFDPSTRTIRPDPSFAGRLAGQISSPPAPPKLGASHSRVTFLLGSLSVLALGALLAALAIELSPEWLVALRRRKR